MLVAEQARKKSRMSIRQEYNEQTRAENDQACRGNKFNL
jgi:hypothetical protein